MLRGLQLSLLLVGLVVADSAYSYVRVVYRGPVARGAVVYRAPVARTAVVYGTHGGVVVAPVYVARPVYYAGAACVNCCATCVTRYRSFSVYGYRVY